MDVLATWRWLLDPRVLVGLSVASLALLAVSALLLPRLVARLPADFFVTPAPRPRGVGWLLFGLRNLAAGLLLLAGIAMLFLPGQGVLTILVSLAFLDFPGRHRALRRLFRWRRARDAMDGLRRRASKPPFEWGSPASAAAGGDSAH